MTLDENIPLLEQACGQMRPYISALADGNLRGIRGWYARHHTAQCPQCTAVLQALRDLRQRLAQLLTEATAPTLTINSQAVKENASLSTENLLRYADEAWERSQQQERASQSKSSTA